MKQKEINTKYKIEDTTTYLERHLVDVQKAAGKDEAGVVYRIPRNNAFAIFSSTGIAK